MSLCSSYSPIVHWRATSFKVYTAREYFCGPSRWWNRFDVLLTGALTLEGLGPNAYNACIHTSQCVIVIMCDHVDNRYYHSCVRVWLFSWYLLMSCSAAGHVSALGSNFLCLWLNLGRCDWVNSQPLLSFRRSSDTRWQYIWLWSVSLSGAWRHFWCLAQETGSNPQRFATGSGGTPGQAGEYATAPRACEHRFWLLASEKTMTTKWQSIQQYTTDTKGIKKDQKSKLARQAMAVWRHSFEILSGDMPRQQLREQPVAWPQWLCIWDLSWPVSGFIISVSWLTAAVPCGWVIGLG